MRGQRVRDMTTFKAPGWDYIAENGMVVIRKSNIHGSILLHYSADCSAGIMSAICLMNTVPSYAPDESVFPSGENTTRVTQCLCSVNVLMHDQSLVLHNRTVLSTDPDAMSDPHGEKHAAKTQSECPSSDEIITPVDASQILAVWSNDADSTALPSGENEMFCTEFVCWCRTTIGSPVHTSQIRTVQS